MIKIVKIVAFFVAFTVLVGCNLCAAEKSVATSPKALKVLMIGNSFSICNLDYRTRNTLLSICAHNTSRYGHSALCHHNCVEGKGNKQG